MSDWNSKQYLKFGSQRTQSAIDLAMRVKKMKPRSVVDIGCGPGNSTAVLKAVFPDADIVGIDNSSNMIEKARMEHPDITFQIGDALSFEGDYDLIFSNACLQWIANHDALIPSLMEKLRVNGILAVQIPMNNEEPLFRLIKEIAQEAKWGLGDIPLPPNETLTPDRYFNILTGCSSSFEIWETKYYHNLPDHKALVEWVKGTRIRPYLEHLSEERGSEFENEIAERAKEFYPLMSSGEVLLGFRRFFFTAVK